MQPKNLLFNDERLVSPEDKALQYSGRIDFDNPKAPVFVFPYSSITMRFTGTKLKVILQNSHAYWNNYLGFLIDGVQQKALIPENDRPVCLNLAEGLDNKEHELFFFKRQDSCHIFSFYGFVVENGAEVTEPEPKPARRIEVFGDSVSAGEVSEAVEYAGKPDPEHNGEYSNAYYSYAAMTARKLNAQIHDTSQGGIPLLHGTGWFGDPDFYGMEEVWDKIEYFPQLSEVKKWDFNKYIPHVAIVAIGQNDSHPDDYMKEDYFSPKSENWRQHYEKFLRTLRKTYPHALIIAATTILEHDSNWDRSIDEACKRINDPKIVHFLYSQNGCGTPGHIRIPEAEKMSDELSAYIQSFGEGIWH